MAGEPSPKRRRFDDNDQHLSIKPRFPHLQEDRQRSGSNSRASTPRSYRDGTPSRPRTEFDGPEPGVDEADAAALDRDWYNTAEDGAVLGDEMHNPFGGTEDITWADQERERALLEKKMAVRSRVNPKHLQRQKDNDAWEANRMLASNVAQTRDQYHNFEDDNDDTRVHLLVHDLKP